MKKGEYYKPLSKNNLEKMENMKTLTSLQDLKSRLATPVAISKNEKISRIVKILIKDKVIQNEGLIEEIKKSLEMLSEESLTIIFEMYTQADIAKLKNKIL